MDGGSGKMRVSLTMFAPLEAPPEAKARGATHRLHHPLFAPLEAPPEAKARGATHRLPTIVLSIEVNANLLTWRCYLQGLCNYKCYYLTLIYIFTLCSQYIILLHRNSSYFFAWIIYEERRYRYHYRLHTARRDNRTQGERQKEDKSTFRGVRIEYQYLLSSST
jgi:hypothetical protein